MPFRKAASCVWGRRGEKKKQVPFGFRSGQVFDSLRSPEMTVGFLAMVRSALFPKPQKRGMGTQRPILGKGGETECGEYFLEVVIGTLLDLARHTR